jgi:hypothetical protein
MTDAITPRPPLADVDLSRLELSIEQACALIDRLRAEKAELLAALKQIEDACQSIDGTGIRYWFSYNSPCGIALRAAIARAESGVSQDGTR